MNQVHLQFEINGAYEDIDIDKSTSFSLNYAIADLENPTASKNTYSNAITIPKTRHNNHIFGQIWEIRSTYSKFNPNKKADFRLHLNNNIFEIGYVKMEEILKDSYKIRLYGNLGNLFSYLNGVKLSELDLNFNHNITSSKVNESRDDYGYALTYQGEYENFDNSLVVTGQEVDEVVWEKTRNNAFQTSGLNENERQMFSSGNFSGEYRSYYQKPVVRLKAIVEAIKAKALKRGFDINLQDDFFTSTSNPYYNNAWIMSNIKNPGEIQGGAYGYSITEFGDDKTSRPASTVKIETNEAVDYNNVPLAASSFISSTSATSINRRVKVSDPITLQPGQTITAKMVTKIIATFYDNSKDNGRFRTKNTRIQGSLLFANAVTGATIGSVATATAAQEKTPVQSRYFGAGANNTDTKRPTNKKGNEYFGEVNFCYDRRSEDNYQPDADTQWQWQASYTNGSTAQDIIVIFEVSGNTWWKAHNNPERRYGIAFRILDGVIRVQGGPTNDDDGRSNTPRVFSDLINNEISCYQFLLSYTKLFGLIYNINPSTGQIVISQRTNFYTDEVLDWTYKVDRSKDFIIEPTQLYFRKGVFKYNPLDTKYENYYKSTASSTLETGLEYGSYVANTGYELGDEEYNYLGDIVFDNCVIATDSNKYFQGRGSGLNDNKELPHLQDDSASRVDISNLILLFKETSRKNLNRSILLSDDNPIMEGYGTICWNNTGIFTTSMNSFLRTATFNGEKYSWNFTPPQLSFAASENNIPSSACIIDRYWRSFLSDRLSDNSKVLTCYVNLTPSEIKADILSKFIYLDQGLWIINKITAFNPVSEEATKVQLVKIVDKQNYLDYTNVTDDFTISYGGNIIFDNKSGGNAQTITIDATTTTVSLSIFSSLTWTATSGLTISPSQGGIGTTNMNVTIPLTTNTGSVTFRYGSNSVNVIINRVIYATVTATTVNGTSAYINGLASPQSIQVGRQATFSSTGDNTFLYWTINGQQFDTEIVSYTIEGDTNAVATYAPTGAVLLYCDDEYTTCSVGNKQPGGYWLLEEGVAYTFTNSQADFTGFLFAGDSSYSPQGSHVITAENTYLEVFYEAILINATVVNHSAINEFVGDNVLIDGYEDGIDFAVDPSSSDNILINTGPDSNFSRLKDETHYPIFSQESFPTAGIYNVTIDGYDVGWIGDESIDAAAGSQTLVQMFYSPIAFTLTSNVQIAPRNGTTNTNITISLTGNGGTVVGRVGEFDYTLTINQEVILKNIGWTDQYLQTIQANVGYDDTSYTEKFYYDREDYVLGVGLTEDNDDGISFDATATFTANPTQSQRTLTFIITVDGLSYQMILTQEGNPTEISYWGQNIENNAVTGPLDGADGLTPSESCQFDIGSESLQYRDAHFCGDVTADRFIGDIAGGTEGTLTFTGGSTQTFNGASDVSVRIPTISSTANNSAFTLTSTYTQLVTYTPQFNGIGVAFFCCSLNATVSAVLSLLTSDAVFASATVRISIGTVNYDRVVQIPRSGIAANDAHRISIVQPITLISGTPISVSMRANENTISILANTNTILAVYA